MVNFFTRVTAIFLPLIILSACTPSTVGGVKESPNTKTYSFETEQGYQSVYKTVLDQSRKCWQGSLVTAQMAVNGDIFTDIGKGTVSVEVHSAFGVNVNQVIDIDKINENKTLVKGYYPRGRPEFYGGILKKWVTEKLKECS